MGMKVKTKPEIKIMMDRLEYLAGKVWMAKHYLNDAERDNIMKRLGYEKIGENKWKFECATVEDTYLINYLIVARKLKKFYRALNKLPNEKMKRLAELRYVEGWAWKEIAKEIEESERMTLSYRETLVKYFKENDCTWALKNDSLYG